MTDTWPLTPFVNELTRGVKLARIDQSAGFKANQIAQLILGFDPKGGGQFGNLAILHRAEGEKEVEKLCSDRQVVGIRSQGAPEIILCTLGVSESPLRLDDKALCNRPLMKECRIVRIFSERLGREVDNLLE